MCPDKERPAGNTAVFSRGLTRCGDISARQNRVCPCQSMVMSVEQNVVVRLKGDINGDGKLTVADYGKVLRHAKGLEMLTGYEFQCGDINGDGKLTVADYGKIFRHAKMLEFLW